MHGSDGEEEDVDPTFTGATLIYGTVLAYEKTHPHAQL